MAFNLDGFLRFTRLALFNTRKTNRRLTLRRVGWALVLYSLYPLLEGVTWAGLGLDELVYGDYRQQEIQQPIFILGNPRSGTTFLHRLLALDERTFAWMPTWQILFAPSIVVRRACRWIASMDRRVGGPLHQLLAAGERYWQQKNYTHKQALLAPEEDENLLLHTWSSLTPWSFGSMLGEARFFTMYDQRVPRQERERAMDFYRRCVQRHLYADGGRPEAGERCYLAKNPAFNSRIESVLGTFPDARFIYVARNPLDAIPSFVSATRWVWDLLGDPIEYGSLNEYALEVASIGYRYPLEHLERLPRDRYCVLRFGDLIGDPERTAIALYEHLGFDVPSAYAQVLREERARARHYRSRHHYSLQALGLSRERIVAECADVFERFGFDTREPGP